MLIKLKFNKRITKTISLTPSGFSRTETHRHPCYVLRYVFRRLGGLARERPLRVCIDLAAVETREFFVRPRSPSSFSLLHVLRSFVGENRRERDLSKIESARRLPRGEKE